MSNQKSQVGAFVDLLYRPVEDFLDPQVFILTMAEKAEMQSLASRNNDQMPDEQESIVPPVSLNQYKHELAKCLWLIEELEFMGEDLQSQMSRTLLAKARLQARITDFAQRSLASSSGLFLPLHYFIYVEELKQFEESHREERIQFQLTMAEIENHLIRKREEAVELRQTIHELER